jgi:FkbM family methyltransferase
MGADVINRRAGTSADTSPEPHDRGKSLAEMPAPELATAAADLIGAPIGYVDIGARGGVHPLVEPIAPAVAVLGFEPDATECVRILAEETAHPRYARLALEPIALSDRAGTAVLVRTTVETNASLREPNPTFVERYAMEKWRPVGRGTVDTATLDGVLLERLGREPHWGEAIKIDTQGTEHEILLGAQRVLRERTLFLCVEVSFCELYLGQKLFSDVEALLRANGFSFYGFDRMFHRSRKSLDKRRYWGRERIIQADAYFFKDPRDRVAPQRPFGSRDAAILALFGLLAGYHDFALEMLEGLGDRAAALRRAVLARAELPVERSRRELDTLASDVKRRAEDANLLIGRFVDERRTRNDYFDVP